MCHVQASRPLKARDTDMRSRCLWVGLSALVLLAISMLEIGAAAQLGQLHVSAMLTGSTADKDGGTNSAGPPGPETRAPGGANKEAPSPPGQGAVEPDEKKPAPEGKVPDEIEQLRLQIVTLQNKGKLGFRKVVACSSVDGFGIYSPIQPGEPISKLTLYFEPANVSTLVFGERFIIDCSVDVFLYDFSGKLLAGKENSLKMNRVSRSPILDLYFKVDLNLKKPTPKGIVVKTVLRDNIKNQSATSASKVNLESKGKSKEIDI